MPCHMIPSLYALSAEVSPTNFAFWRKLSPLGSHGPMRYVSGACLMSKRFDQFGEKKALRSLHLSHFARLCLLCLAYQSPVFRNVNSVSALPRKFDPKQYGNRRYTVCVFPRERGLRIYRREICIKYYLLALLCLLTQILAALLCQPWQLFVNRLLK